MHDVATNVKKGRLLIKQFIGLENFHVISIFDNSKPGKDSLIWHSRMGKNHPKKKHSKHHLCQLQRFGIHTPASGFCCSFQILPVTLNFSSFLSPPEKKRAIFRWIISPSWLSRTFRWLSRTLLGVPSHINFLPLPPTSRL